MQEFFTTIWRNKFNVLLVVTSAVIGYLIFKKPDLFQIDFKKDFHKDIITLSSVFGGFSFTTYGIIIGLSNQKIMRRLERMGFTSPYYFSVSLSLLAIVISLIFSLLGLFLSELNESILIAKIELFSFIVGILFFIASILNVLSMQKLIRKSIRESDD